MKVGQIATVVLVILAAVWTPQIEKFGSLFEYLQIVLGLICPPVVAVFILGLFWKRANANGAFYSLIVGFVLALFMIVSQIGGFIPELNEIHFLHKAPILLLVCLVLHVTFSLASAKPPTEKVKDYTYSMSIFKEETKELAALPWYQNFRYLAVILLVITIIIVGAFW